MWDDISTEDYKKRLIERQNTIRENRDARKKDTVPVTLDQTRVGRLSRMDAMQQREMSQASARLISLERQRIKSALSRIESGDYGYCILCDEEIGEKRLQFDPSILTCISCAEKEERKK